MASGNTVSPYEDDEKGILLSSRERISDEDSPMSKRRCPLSATGIGIASAFCCCCVLPPVVFLLCIPLMNAIARREFGAFGTAAFGSTTLVKSVSLGVIGGNSRVSGVSVDGFLYVGDGEVDADLWSAFSDRWHFQELAMDTVSVAIKQQPTGEINAEEIIHHLGTYIQTHQTATTKWLLKKKVIVDRILFTNIKFTVDLRSPVLPAVRGPIAARGPMPFNISEIVVVDIGKKENGITVAKLIAHVVQVLMQALLQKVPKQIYGVLAQRLLSGFVHLIDATEVRVNLGQGLEKVGDKIGQIAHKLGGRAAQVGESIAGRIDTVANRTEKLITNPFDKMLSKASPSDQQNAEKFGKAFHKFVDKPFKVLRTMAGKIENVTQVAGNAVSGVGDRASNGVRGVGKFVEQTLPPLTTVSPILPRT